ncbi:ArgE/DapE family deacylase [Siminovitchia sediminis]|uniref:Probable succinyl-diaminopimelate desuccinylase n=1 Tax=Siminovitchia sediminis TaxID=1274353 RepID=A0ABW4KHX3_9BACI
MDREQAISFLQEIIQIKSVNPPGNETEVALKIQALFNQHGIETELVEYDENRTNLIARLMGENSGPVLGLTGHMDVVPTGEIEWEHDPFGAEEVNGNIYGRGAVDMKSGLAACALSMVSLKEQGFPKRGEIILLATVGEEAGAVGARQLTEKGYADHLDALIIAEPTNNQIKIAHKGALWPQIVTYGKTSHGSMPEVGVNAVVHMNEIIQRILDNPFHFEDEEDPLLGRPSFSVNVIQGGSNTNVVPDQCSANIDIRTIPSLDHQQIIQQIEQVIERTKEKYPELKAKVRILNDQAPVKTSGDDPFVKLVQSVVKAADGPIELGGMTGYTDGSQFVSAKKKFPIIILGPGETSLAHQPDEFVEIDKYLNTVHLYQEIAKKFLT